MTLRTRMLFLFALLLGGFAVAIALLHMAEQDERVRIVEAAQTRGTQNIARWLNLAGVPMQQFVEDYSWWDEMVEFVREPDPEWAQTNLEEMLEFFDLSAMWVVDLTGNVVYQTSTEAFETASIPLTQGEIVDLVETTPYPHFFRSTEFGLLELRASPVQPSDDDDRVSPPRGWFVVGRVWDAERIKQLADATGTVAAILAPDIAPSNPLSESDITVLQPLANESGDRVATLRATRHSPEIESVIETDTRELAIFVGFGVFGIVAVAGALRRWVLHPLDLTTRALSERDPSHLTAMTTENHEFGRVARLVESSFRQTRKLETEIRHRRETESALKDSEKALRETSEERAQLGRDLHDSVIQTLYASGLGLSATRKLIAEDPGEAASRLHQVQCRLNETIRELRLFITGLEPESTKQKPFSEALRDMIEFLPVIRPIDSHLEIHEDVAARFSPLQAANTLQIVREAVSNSIRHGKAKKLTITLKKDQHHAELRLTDDGIGFDPPATATSNRGIANMHERAREAGGSLEISSSNANGTHLRLALPLSPAP